MTNLSEFITIFSKVESLIPEEEYFNQSYIEGITETESGLTVGIYYTDGYGQEYYKDIKIDKNKLK